jgi:hypothetical protein
MKQLVAAFAVLMFSVLATLPAHAAGMRFGDSEDLTTIVDVGVTGAEGEALMLGYKITTHNFLLPWSMSDDGYVLVVKDDTSTYYAMSEAEIAEWQQSGLLPDPLPVYEITLLDRVMGHLLWPTLVVIGIVLLVQAMRKRRKQAPVAQ